jgi:hypothetical protein
VVKIFEEHHMLKELEQHSEKLPETTVERALTDPWIGRADLLCTVHCDLNSLKWLQRNGCPWDGNVIHWAQDKGLSDVLEWARNNGCPAEMEQLYSEFILC